MNSPKIRFKGYTEDWEQRKLDDVTVKIGSGKTPSGGENAYVDAGIPLIRSQNVNDNKVDFEDIVYIDESTDKLMMNSRVFANDVLLNITGASIGRSAVYKGLDEGNVNQHVCIIRPIEGYHPDFIQLNLASDRGQKQIKSSQTGGGREGLNFQQIGKMKFVFPTLDEQKQIGNYFNNIDHLITLHQRKCEQTKTLKKYMLQKMFPQEGQKVPEIRFEGFTGDWEQRKVSEIAIEKLSNGIMNNQVNDETGLRHINVINMYDPDKIHPEKLTFSGYDEDAVKKCNVELGDIFLTRSSLKPEGIAEANVLLDSGRFVYDDHLIRLKVDKEKYDPFFVKLNLSERAFKRQFIIRAKTTAFTTIGQEDIAECSGLFPEKKEQEKIGTYFSQLDHLITLHQREYEKLQELKKFMLQNMFV